MSEINEPDYMVTYRRYWADIVEPDGVLNRDQVARELSDYTVVMEQASAVYEELAGLSKPNTAAVHILAGAEQKYAETYADFACDRASQAYAEGDTEAGDILRELAEDWHEGAWNEYKAGRERVAALLAKRAESSTPEPVEATDEH